ncbi:MAG: hypothetical protein KBS81_02545 [Spirochaetales bacterium]|nr:hypothetical protein [Candidatus Physcosoma equi]
MKKTLLFLLLLLLFLGGLSAEPQRERREEKETISFLDDAGRIVELPVTIERVAPSGGVATIMLSALSPEMMTNTDSRPSGEQLKYLPKELETLPTSQKEATPSSSPPMIPMKPSPTPATSSP